MILKLYKNQVFIEPHRIPEDVHSVEIEYQYELGTNHLKPKLTINNKIYTTNPIHLDLSIDNVVIKVELLDAYGNVVHTYHGNYKYKKTCTIGTEQHMDVYNELYRLYKEYKKLKDQGEVI